MFKYLFIFIIICLCSLIGANDLFKINNNYVYSRNTKDTTETAILVDFSTETYKWKLVDDPVMGGKSFSNITVKNNVLNWYGEVKLVPSLNAPGFCSVETISPYSSKFVDISNYTHLEIKVRSSYNATGYKVSFAANTLNPQFHSFKAGFNLIGDNKWHIIQIPFTSFSNDWSPYTGDCGVLDPAGRMHKCCTKDTPEVCPNQKNLKSIQQIALWMEGKTSKFDINVEYIGASNGSDNKKNSKQF